MTHVFSACSLQAATTVQVEPNSTASARIASSLRHNWTLALDFHDLLRRSAIMTEKFFRLNGNHLKHGLAQFLPKLLLSETARWALSQEVEPRSNKEAVASWDGSAEGATWKM